MDRYGRSAGGLFGRRTNGDVLIGERGTKERVGTAWQSRGVSGSGARQLVPPAETAALALTRLVFAGGLYSGYRCGGTEGV